jgi:hypothetical protein
MVIGRRFRYVFIEVPHTGSTAVATELCLHYGGDVLYHKHSNYPEYWALAGEDERRYCAFAGVRNPLDTVVTDYLRYHMNPNGQYTDPKMLEANGGWVSREHVEKFEMVKGGASFAEYFRRYHQKLYFNWYLASHRPFDLVLRNESLGADFEEALRRIGAPLVRPLPVKNKTTDKRDFASYYTPDVREQAVRVFGPFMKQWGYPFPEVWGDVKVPFASAAQYQAMDRAYRVISRVARFGPHDPRTREVRRLVPEWRSAARG